MQDSKTLLVATRSRGKMAEFRTLLSGLDYQIVFPDEMGLTEMPMEATLETGTTFEENARIKAEWFATRSGLLTLADDSGLEVEALHGAPGVRSKRFAGKDGADHQVTAANNAALLKALTGVASSRRRAKYRCVLIIAEPGSEEEVGVEGVTTGVILESARGSGGFGYDPLFFSEELGKTFGEATAEEKHSVSHRGRAAAALRRALGRG